MTAAVALAYDCGLGAAQANGRPYSVTSAPYRAAVGPRNARAVARWLRKKGDGIVVTSAADAVTDVEPPTREIVATPGGHLTSALSGRRLHQVARR